MKTYLKPAHEIVAQSTAANFNSPAIPVPQADIVGLQVNYSGSPAGTLKVQASLDHDQDPYGNILNAGNWADLYFSLNGVTTNTITLPTATSPIFIDMSLGSMPFVRLSYTGSGAGTLDCYVTYKRLGD